MMRKEYPELVTANEKGEIFNVPGLGASGMRAGYFYPLDASRLVRIHPDSELFMLPSRKAVGYDRISGEFVPLGSASPGRGQAGTYAVSAFMAPGYTALDNAAYVEAGRPAELPLFSYGAVAYYKGDFYVSAVRVDREKRQELAGMPLRELKKGVVRMKRSMPENRLVRHLEGCALTYGCPAAKNFFLERYEAPLPTSPSCNARCVGCISYQESEGCPVTQPRIDFVPSPREIAEIALHHMSKVSDPVVSFGQGCEGEPLMVGEVLLDSVKLIREKTSKGIINLNTNASRPDIIRRLFASGLDSIRVSMNSARERYYNAYYRPRDYSFKDVLCSIRAAKKAGGFVSVNYLSMPGFTDSRSEARALLDLIGRTGVDMVQWRNLNYDPLAYFRRLGSSVEKEDILGMDRVMEEIKKRYPDVMHGYFNPSRGRIRRKRACTGKR